MLQAIDVHYELIICQSCLIHDFFFSLHVLYLGQTALFVNNTTVPHQDPVVYEDWSAIPWKKRTQSKKALLSPVLVLKKDKCL